MDLPLHDSITTLFATSLATALLGGWHCAGMCGAIASLASQKRAIFLYQVGRLISYLSLGAVAGLAGGRILTAWDASQRWWVMIPLAVLSYWVLVSTWKLPAAQKIQFFLWRKRPKASWVPDYLLLGVLNGLIPCHWLYGFLFVAAGLQSPARGAGLLFCLWLGALPWLLGFSLFGKKVRLLSERATWAAAILMAFVFLGLIAHQLPH